MVPEPWISQQMQGASLRITLHFTNVKRPISAADAFLEAGCSVNIDGDNKVGITPGGTVMKAVRRLQSWRLKLKRSTASQEPALILMTVAKSSATAKQLSIALGHDKVEESARPAACSGRFDPSQSDAHPQVHQDVDETTTVRRTTDMSELKVSMEALKARAPQTPLSLLPPTSPHTMPPMHGRAQH